MSATPLSSVEKNCQRNRPLAPPAATLQLVESDSMINPFVMDVLAALKESGHKIKIYLLIEALDEAKLEPLLRGIDANLALFRRNFLLMNALYQIQQDMLKTGWYLYIGQVEVELRSIANTGTDLIESAGEERLREYYNNWNHFVGTDSEQVLDLLTNFWQRFGSFLEVSTDATQKARDLLNLADEEADMGVIKQRYREKVQRLHPDKGGDTAEFIRVREAYELLIAHSACVD